MQAHLSRRDFTRFAIGATAATLSFSGCSSRNTPRCLGEVPNIILAMSDDQGWGDTGYNGHPYRYGIFHANSGNGASFYPLPPEELTLPRLSSLWGMSADTSASGTWAIFWVKKIVALRSWFRRMVFHGPQDFHVRPG